MWSRATEACSCANGLRSIRTCTQRCDEASCKQQQLKLRQWHGHHTDSSLQAAHKASQPQAD